ncbi:Sucrose-6-phosphate hydrolase [Clostridium fungisolvens]|uniref:Sucrose-6-phosphate hydrolase n=1 Tax=Clostridium fungisolvens TaxID=1604897 RepID=A0A6V8SGY4_9CLOT|nr:Sucrose-6-phosphate hydrolase [Clostridium fungisolvens]
MLNKEKELIDSALEEIDKKISVVESDYYRPVFHIAPKVGLLNDPNGFVFFNGYYHLFYQWHPFSTNHGLKYWYHLRSKDLVNWEDLRVGLVPSNWYESHGCYSGSAIEYNDEIRIFYTGNVKNSEGNRESYQCMGSSKDGINIEKNMQNPIIKSQPKGYSAHFRDPKVWKENELFYMVLGAQTDDLEGRVLLYKSEDLSDWDLVGVVSGSNINGNNAMGYMWECPDLFSIGDKDVLITCPQGIKEQGILYNNRYQAGYFTGKLDYMTGAMEHGSFNELDRGFEFYAPQSCKDYSSRRVMYGWMGMPEEEEQPTKDFGWMHMLTLPRILELKEEKIYQRVPKELEKLRKEKTSVENIHINNCEITLENFYGDVYELLLEFDIEESQDIGIKLRCSDDDSEYTLLNFSSKTNLFTVDRTSSGKYLGGKRQCKLNINNKLKLQIFSDRSSLEIFINDGEEVFTLRIFPSIESKNIRFIAKDKKVKLNKATLWTY